MIHEYSDTPGGIMEIVFSDTFESRMPSIRVIPDSPKNLSGQRQGRRLQDDDCSKFLQPTIQPEHLNMMKTIKPLANVP
jgi:hypothetical protein